MMIGSLISTSRPNTDLGSDSEHDNAITGLCAPLLNVSTVIRGG
jgi:hypothetical protein